MLPLLISYAIMAATLLLCDCTRNLLLPSLLGPSSALSKVLTDAVLSVELCATAFEMGAIIEHYGVNAWMLGLFCVAFYQVLRWKEQAFPNPYVHLINFLAGVEGAVEASLRSLVLIVSGLLSYRIAKVIWAAELSDIHVGRADAVDACSVPWADVPTSTAAASEFLGTLFLNIVPGLAFDNPYLANNDPKYTAALVAAIVLGTVLAALGFSGGMFNPLLATVLLGGCEGHDYIQHIVIYWAASTAGAIAAFYVYPVIKTVLYPPKDGKKLA